MAPKKKNAPKRSQKPAARVSGQIRLKRVGEAPVRIRHLDAPPKFVRRVKIHPRRILPRIAEGRDRNLLSASRAVTLQPQAFSAMRAASAGTISLVTTTPLDEPATQQLASNVGEPSVAVNGDTVVCTGNWYAARSVDGGQTFSYMDPFRDFPLPDGLAFCCDQVVNYISSIDTFVWLMQYGPSDPKAPQQDNLQRLAFAKTADVQNGHWTLFDLTTDALGVSGLFLDFPDLAVGANNLYVTSNLFTPQGNGAGAVVVRIPIASIASGAPTASKFVATDPTLNSFRVAQNCGNTAYFATHKDTSTLNVFSWAESAAAPTSNLVEVARWVEGQGFTSRTPDGQRWLDRADSRITGATLAGSDLYFCWGSDAGGTSNNPQPFVQVAQINASDLTLINNINIFDSQSAICYGALSTNAAGEVGISYMIGGGPRFPSHVVGILTDPRQDTIVAQSARGPLPTPSTGKGEWGDYLTVRPVFPDRELFAATGYTLDGPGNGSNLDATPRYVTFGRAGGVVPVAPDARRGPGTKPPKPPSPRKPLPPTPPEDGDPISDVNTLTVVSATVGQQIKAACGLGSAPTEAEAMAEMEVAAAPEQDKPGTERWPVKTGQDEDRAKVGKNVLLDSGQDLGMGIVEATLEELISLPRPSGLENDKQDPPQFQTVRDGQTEVTIWRIECKILAVKHEADGDYHLVLQGTSGQEMVGEIPTPTTVFVGDSPWLQNISDARQQIDDKVIQHISPQNFAINSGTFMPHGAMMNPAPSALPGIQFTTPPPNSNIAQPLFQTAIQPTAVRLTGVGFFDRAHGQTGSAPNVIELHPVLKVEFL